MQLENPAAVRVVESVTRSDEQALFLQHDRAIEERHDRDVELMRSLIRTLREPRGRLVPLVDEFKRLVRETEDVT